MRALYLDNPETEGWDILAAFAADATGDAVAGTQGRDLRAGRAEARQRGGAALGDTTGTSSAFWYYPNKDGLEVRDRHRARSSRFTGKLGMHLVWVYPDESPSAAVFTENVRIVLPSGTFGFVAAEALVPLPSDLLCYVKNGNTWQHRGLLRRDCRPGNRRGTFCAHTRRRGERAAPCIITHCFFVVSSLSRVLARPPTPRVTLSPVPARNS